MGSAWWTTPNEKRQAMNFGVDEENEEMNDYYIPANLMPMKNDIIEEEIKSIDIDLSKMYDDRETDSYHDDKEQIRTDVFTTSAEAQQRANELGCAGTHSHTDNGETIYMPCATHEEYIDLTGQDVKLNSFSVASFDKRVNKK